MKSKYDHTEKIGYKGKESDVSEPNPEPSPMTPNPPTSPGLFVEVFLVVVRLLLFKRGRRWEGSSTTIRMKSEDSTNTTTVVIDPEEGPRVELKLHGPVRFLFGDSNDEDATESRNE